MTNRLFLIGSFEVLFTLIEVIPANLMLKNLTPIVVLLNTTIGIEFKIKIF